MAEVSKSAIVSHAFADLGERCSFCGQLVKLEFERDFGEWWFDSDEIDALLDQEKGVADNPSPITPSELVQGPGTLFNTKATHRDVKRVSMACINCRQKKLKVHCLITLPYVVRSDYT